MSLQVRNLDTADEKVSFDHGEIQLTQLTGATIGRAVFNPGWKWSLDAGPRVGTATCQAAHLGVVLAGRFRVRMDDGTEVEMGPGDAHVVPPGHDAWVVGDEQCIILDVAPTSSARAVDCPCGVQFRISGGEPDQLDHLVAAVQQHAGAVHGHEASRDDILAELSPA